jgi:hypothetical protein
MQMEKAVMDHKAEDEAVKGEDPETISQRPGIGKEVWQTATYQTVKDSIIQLVVEKMSQIP